MTRDLCIFLFFHFADDMGVCVFWVCPTTPMSSAGSINIRAFKYTNWHFILPPGPCGLARPPHI